MTYFTIHRNRFDRTMEGATWFEMATASVHLLSVGYALPYEAFVTGSPATFLLLNALIVDKKVTLSEDKKYFKALNEEEIECAALPYIIQITRELTN